MATSTMDGHSEISKPLPLLDLPPELRVMIYDMFFAGLSCTSPFPADDEIHHATALLYSSRQMLDEAGDVFIQYEQLFKDMIILREKTRGKATRQHRLARFQTLSNSESRLEVYWQEFAERLNIQKWHDDEYRRISQVAEAVRRSCLS